MESLIISSNQSSFWLKCYNIFVYQILGNLIDFIELLVNLSFSTLRNLVGLKQFYNIKKGEIRIHKLHISDDTYSDIQTSQNTAKIHLILRIPIPMSFIIRITSTFSPISKAL